MAEATGLHAAFLSQIASGARPAPADKCADIELATGHAVRRWDLRPNDWFRIWPELVGTDGAPEVAADAAVPTPAIQAPAAPRGAPPPH